MKLLNKTLASLIILSALSVTGCATNPNENKEILDEKNITIDRVDSKRAHIGRIHVIEENDAFLIHGKIRLQPHSRGPVPGHIDMQIIGKDGKSKLRSKDKIYRKNRNTKSATFKFKIDVELEENDVIRLTHHYPTGSSYSCCDRTADVEN